eukprot:364705-Chlamydomonas_euryale.AAC.21
MQADASTSATRVVPPYPPRPEHSVASSQTFTMSMPRAFTLLIKNTDDVKKTRTCTHLVQNVHNLKVHARLVEHLKHLERKAACWLRAGALDKRHHLGHV